MMRIFIANKVGNEAGDDRMTKRQKIGIMFGANASFDLEITNSFFDCSSFGIVVILFV